MPDDERQTCSYGLNVRFWGLLLAVVSGFMGCQYTRWVALPVEAPASCVLFPEAIRSLDTIRVWADEEGNVPLRESVVQTLITVDCEGRLSTGLAKAWDVDEEARVWRFFVPESRAGLAEELVQKWRAKPDVSTVIDSLATPDPRVLDVYVRPGFEAQPQVLAQPRFAVSTQAGEQAVSRIRVVEQGGRDMRDVLGEDVDFIVTRDPDVIAYGRERQDVAVQPLVWDQIYVLVVPDGIRPDAGFAPTFNSELARDAVRSEARAHNAPGWWTDRSGCSFGDGTRMGSRSRIAPKPRIVYDEGDPVARDLAERLSTLTGVDGHPMRAVFGAHLTTTERLLAYGVSDASYSARLAGATEAAFIFALPKEVMDRCHAHEQLGERMPWLVGDEASTFLLPLVETRKHAIAHRGVGPLVVDGLGHIRLYTPALETP